MPHRLTLLLKVGVTLLGLAWVLTQIDFGALAAVLRGARAGLLPGALALMLAGLALRAWRWQLLLRGMGARIGFGRLLHLYLVGTFFNAFLPTGFGGDVVRAAQATRDLPPHSAAASVIADRANGLAVLFWLALLAWPLRPAGLPAAQATLLLLLALGGTLAGLLPVSRRLMARLPLPRPLHPLRTLAGQPWRQALAVSLLFNLLLGGWWGVIGRSLAINAPWHHWALVVPLFSLALLVPSLGGLGVREALAPLLLAGTGATAEQAVGVALIVLILERLASLPGGLLYLWSLRK
jgi:uncharacterized membrane protein YbhN (UPF0104 family)